VLQNYNNITCAADIFSLGMTILELSTDLDLPRSGELWHQLRSAQVPSNLIRSLSSNLVEIIMKMIEPDHLIRATSNQLLQMPKVKNVLFKDNISIIFEKVTSNWSYIKNCFYNFFIRLTYYFANSRFLFNPNYFLNHNKTRSKSNDRLNESNINKIDHTSTPKKPEQVENLLCFVQTDDEDLKGI